MNLVANARDAMPTGGTLTIETSDVLLGEGDVRAKAGKYIRLTVRDTGTGMSEATRTRIFEPFFTTKAMGAGTGLGLATAFGIVARGGGNIRVDSRQSGGTTFEVLLPQVESDVALSAPSLPPAMLRGTETILLVEDDNQLRAVVRSTLERMGYTVVEAPNGREALAVFERSGEAVKLLLTDVIMPQLSGPELAKRLTTLRPEIRVLCMSGYTEDSTVRHGLLEGRFAFLQKPITPGELVRKVREVLDSSRA
jgi:CheY-like chemotaxis protein